eukprot:TRINITY_DN47163_c0_g1_i1.p1 TRINITY_DN47163_c0_g1~~TRINITY_DN47163_c0_g1_i1.p1  ORF type:complete len:113 (-),score=26.13 TRINITY_DN47163_c0_g1_i1:66-404(-)
MAASPMSGTKSDGEKASEALAQSMLDAKLKETGEREKLKQYITTHLNECGWREELKKQCIEFVQNKGAEKVTMEEITADIAPRGRATLPEDLKLEVFNRLRAFAERQGLEPQ